MKKPLSWLREWISKGVAYLLYVEIWVIHFSTSGFIEPMILFLAMLFGFSGTQLNWFNFICMAYVGQVLSGIVMFHFLFKSRHFEEWIYHHVGRDRVREKIYR